MTYSGECHALHALSSPRNLASRFVLTHSPGRRDLFAIRVVQPPADLRRRNGPPCTHGTPTGRRRAPGSACRKRAGRPGGPLAVRTQSGNGLPPRRTRPVSLVARRLVGAPAAP